MNTAQRAARRPRTNPACTARTHQSLTAARRHHCSCADALAKLEAYKTQDAARPRDPSARHREGVCRAPDFDAPPVPEVPQYGEVARRVLRAELPCRSVDAELFFAVDPAATRVAKTVCARCPVLDDCLTWALQEGLDGVYGGTTFDERATIRASCRRPAS